MLSEMETEVESRRESNRTVMVLTNLASVDAKLGKSLSNTVGSLAHEDKAIQDATTIESREPFRTLCESCGLEIGEERLRRLPIRDFCRDLSARHCARGEIAARTDGRAQHRISKLDRQDGE